MKDSWTPNWKGQHKINQNTPKLTFPEQLLVLCGQGAALSPQAAGLSFKALWLLPRPGRVPAASWDFWPLTTAAKRARSSLKVPSCHCSSHSESQKQTNKPSKQPQLPAPGANSAGTPGPGGEGAAAPPRCPGDTGASRSPSLPECLPPPRRAAQPRGSQRGRSRCQRRPRPGRAQRLRCQTQGTARGDAFPRLTAERGATPEPGARRAALPPSRPRLTRRLALSPAALARRWSSVYFSSSRGCSETSAMTAAPTARSLPPRANRRRRSNCPPRQPIGWTGGRGRGQGGGAQEQPMAALPAARGYFQGRWGVPGWERRARCGPAAQ